MNDGGEKRFSNERLAALFLRLATRELKTSASHLKRRFRVFVEESDPWKAREEIESLSGTIHRLSRLIETLSDTADIESQRVSLENAEINLAHLFSERISKRLWRFPSYRFLPEMPSRLETWGDKRRLASLIDDLLDAAIHVAPDGGIIHALLTKENGQVVLSTHNRDAKIPTSRFESFIDWMEEDVENPEALRGISISLYRSYRAARMLGGRLELMAPPEGGAAFTVKLPDGESPHPPPSGSPPA